MKARRWLNAACEVFVAWPVVLTFELIGYLTEHARTRFPQLTGDDDA